MTRLYLRIHSSISIMMKIFTLLIISACWSFAAVAAAAARDTTRIGVVAVEDARFFDTAWRGSRQRKEKLRFGGVFHPSTTTTAATTQKLQLLLQQPPPVRSNALLLRGGGGGFSLYLVPEPLTAAKWYSRIGLVQGVLMISSPSAMNAWYGITPSTLQSDWLVDCIGHGLICSFVFMYCLLDRSSLDVNHAMAYSLIGWLLFTIRQVLNDKQGALSVGYKKEGFVAGMLLHAMTIFTVFFADNNAMANILVKLEAIFWTISGLLFFLFPRSSAKLWGRQEDYDDTAVLCLMKLVGASWLSSCGAAAWLLFFPTAKNDAVALTTTRAAVQAFGYGALVWVAHFINTLFISKDIDKLGLCKLPTYAWAILNIVFSYLMLRGGASTGNVGAT